MRSNLSVTEPGRATLRVSSAHAGDSAPVTAHVSLICPISQDALQLLSEALTVLINYKAIVYGANNFWRRISSKLSAAVSPPFIQGSENGILQKKGREESSKCVDDRSPWETCLLVSPRAHFKDENWPRYWHYGSKAGGSKWAGSSCRSTCISFRIWHPSTAARGLLVCLTSVSFPHLHRQLGNRRHKPFINSNSNVMGRAEKWGYRSGVCKQWCATIYFKYPVPPQQGTHSQRFTVHRSHSTCSAANMDNWMIPHVQYVQVDGSDKHACEKTTAALLDNLCSCV